MSKPIRAGVTRAKTVRVWHVGQSGRRMVMMLSPSRSGGSVTELSVTDRYRAGGDRASMEPSRSDSRSILLIVEKLMTRSAPNSLRTLPCECPAWIEGRASRKWNPNCSCSVRHRLRAPNQSSRPYAQDPRFNAGTAASSVVRSEKQPGCHNVQEIAINRVAKHAENNWSLCVLAAGAADANTAARAAAHVQTVLRRDYDLLTD
jgi:hypothetical protein